LENATYAQPTFDSARKRKRKADGSPLRRKIGLPGALTVCLHGADPEIKWLGVIDRGAR
jgi:hypothetical protein